MTDHALNLAARALRSLRRLFATDPTLGVAAAAALCLAGVLAVRAAPWLADEPGLAAAVLWSIAFAVCEAALHRRLTRDRT